MRETKNPIASMLLAYRCDLVPETLLKKMVFAAVRDYADMITLKSHNEFVTHSLTHALVRKSLSCHRVASRSSFELSQA